LVPTFAAIAILFQNCSNPAQISDASLAKETAQKIDAKYGMVYDVEADTLAYMSCDDDSAMSPAVSRQTDHFKFRWGAYGTKSGLKLQDNFVEDNIRKTKELLVESLGYSQANSNTRIQFAVRSAAQMQRAFIASGNAPSEGREYHNIMPMLGTLEMNLALFNAWDRSRENRIRHVRDGTVAGARFEATLAMRERFINGGQLFDLSGHLNASSPQLYLTQTFTEAPVGSSNSQSILARSPYSIGLDNNADENRYVYGRRYAPSFIRPNSIVINGLAQSVHQGATSQTRVLSGVVEERLDGRTDLEQPKAWSCPQEYWFRIVRMDKASAVIPGTSIPDCPLVSDLDQGQAAQSTIQALRRVLPAESWFINVANRCIVNKNAAYSCYGPQSLTNPVNISWIGNACDPGNNNMRCTDFFSMCVAQ
jgi:hypothetical protein